MISNPEIIENLVNINEKGYISNKILYAIKDYIQDDSLSTTIIKTNLLTVFGNHLKYPLDHFVSNNISSNFIVKPQVYVPVRSLAEIEIGRRFSYQFPQMIEKCLLTGDTIKFLERVHNSHQDLQTTLNNSHFGASTRTFDVKSDNIKSDEFFKGRVHEINLYGADEIWLPNKLLDLNEYYINQLNRLYSDTILKRFKISMDSQHFDYFHSILENMHYKSLRDSILNKNINIYEVLFDIENMFMSIQTIPSYPQAFNFINVYRIKDSTLSQDEMKFINQELSKITDNTIFTNERRMQQFLCQSLERYNHHMDKGCFRTLAPLGIKYPWLLSNIKRGLVTATDYLTNTTTL